jgi:hypothetical protein
VNDATTGTETDWRERALAAEAALAETRQERARLWEEVTRLRAERREVEYYERLAEGMRTSVSWQVTAPLRSGKVLAAKVRHKLDKRRD